MAKLYPKDPALRGAQIYEELVQLFKDELGVKRSFFHPDLKLAEVYSPPSFAELANQISEHFKIKVTGAAVKKAETVTGLTLLIMSKLP